MAATGNPFAELENIGSLEPFATRREILDQLKVAGENDTEEREKAAPQLPRTLSKKVGQFSEAELDSFKNEGWTVVPPRARTRPSPESIGDTPSYDSAESVEAVVPRALPTGIPPPQTPDTPTTLPTEKSPWKYLRWGAMGVLGALALAKLASRR